MTTQSVLSRTALVLFLLVFSFVLGFVTRRFALDNAGAAPFATGLPHALVFPAFALPVPHPLQLP